MASKEQYMFQGRGLYRDTLDVLDAWIPSENYGHERKFQDELQDVLYQDLSSGGQGMMQQSRDIPVEKEHGKSKADLAVDDTVGIEMKRDLSNSQNKKLRGQIESYLDNYNYVIVCACGIKDKSGWRKLKNRYEGTQGMGGQEVSFIWKKSENFGEEPERQSSQGREPFGNGVF